MIKNNKLLLEICKISLLAGDEILKIYNDEIEVIQKEDLSPLTKADIASNKIILRSLESIDNSIPILSEESLINWNERKKWKKYCSLK